ncbi:hypothetical protein FBZ85_10259 [Azospirillum brasilense]|nr:hypothetical protein FBZ85_10259 [Azospirillum brasilense]
MARAARSVLEWKKARLERKYREYRDVLDDYNITMRLGDEWSATDCFADAKSALVACDVLTKYLTDLRESENQNAAECKAASDLRNILRDHIARGVTNAGG